MANVSGQAPREGVHLVLYDDECGLCSRLLQFVLRHDRRRVFAFTSLQGAYGRAVVEDVGGRPNDLTSIYVIANHRLAAARALTRSGAVLFVARELGWPWKAAALLSVVPAALLDCIYDLVARHRYRFFGRWERCLVPQAEFRSRFLK